MDSKLAMRGTCMDMCPESERKKRSEDKLLDERFEKNDGAIKQFSRSAAGKKFQTADELRPSSVLLKTMNHLLSNIVTRKDVKYCVIYDFVNDRIQAIRQDMIIQELDDEDTLETMEKATRFYIVSLYRLHELSPTYFDTHLCDKQLMICLKRLLILYAELKPNCPERELYLSVYAVYKLGSWDVLHYILNFKAQFPDDVLDNAIKLNFAYSARNFVAFLKIKQKLPRILQMCLYQHTLAIQLMAIRVMCTAYSSKNTTFPLSVATNWFELEVEDTMKMCRHVGIKVDDQHICFLKSDFVETSEVLDIVNKRLVETDDDFYH